jgi:hypothetical protein
VLNELRKNGLINNIRRQLDLQHQYERIRDLTSDPKEKERANGEILSVRLSMEAYVAELTGLPTDEVGELPADLLQLIDLHRASQQSSTRRPAAIRILFLASSPTDQARLRLDQEGRDIDEKLRLARLRDAFELHTKTAVRPQDLTQALLDVIPHVVHFSGHGSADGAIYLEDGSGQAHPVAPVVLGNLFKLVANSVQCVLLNACYSEAQALAIVQYIPFVIGMTQAISDSAAIAFAAGFYQAFGARQSIERAYEFGLVQVGLQNIPESSTPILLRRNNNP